MNENARSGNGRNGKSESGGKTGMSGTNGTGKNGGMNGACPPAGRRNGDGRLTDSCSYAKRMKRMRMRERRRIKKG